MTAGPRIATYNAGKQAEHQRKHELDADLAGPFLRPLTTFRARHLGMRSQRLRDAGAEPVGLHQHRDERANIVDLGARREILERLDSRLAGAHLGRDEPQLFRERRIRDLQLVARLHDRLVDARACLDAHDHQIERIGKPVPNLLLAERGLPAEPHTGQHVAERRAPSSANNQRENPKNMSARPPTMNGNSASAAPYTAAAVKLLAGGRQPSSEPPHVLRRLRYELLEPFDPGARCVRQAQLRQTPSGRAVDSRRAPAGPASSSRARRRPALPRPRRPTQTPRAEHGRSSVIRQFSACDICFPFSTRCDDFPDDEHADDLQHERADDHLDAERIGVELPVVFRDREGTAQSPAPAAIAASTHPVMRPCAEMTRTWRLTRKRSRMIDGEVVEHFGEVAAGFALRQHRGDEEPRIDQWDAIARTP